MKHSIEIPDSALEEDITGFIIERHPDVYFHSKKGTVFQFDSKKDSALRYSGYTGQTGPMALKDSIHLLSELTGKNYHMLYTQILSVRKNQELFLNSSGQLIPDAFLFIRDFYDASEMLVKFGWDQTNDTQLDQYANIFSAISNKSLTEIGADITRELNKAYPALAGKFQKHHLPPVIAEGLISKYLDEDEVDAIAKGISYYSLSPMEYAVLLRIVRGEPNRIIAKLMNDSPHTIKNHITSILQKMRLEKDGVINPGSRTKSVESRKHIALRALEDGMVPTKLIEQIMDHSILEKIESLLPAERKILNLLIEGYSNKQISHQLKISYQGVKNFNSIIFRKLGFHSAVEIAVRYNLAIRFNQANKPEITIEDRRKYRENTQKLEKQP